MICPPIAAVCSVFPHGADGSGCHAGVRPGFGACDEPVKSGSWAHRRIGFDSLGPR